MNKNWLVHEFDNYDPEDDLSDIMTGKFLKALSELPQSLIQLIQEGDLHVQLKEVDGRYRVTKIIKKREPEFIQGQDQYFIYDDEGKRIPLSEREFDRYVCIKHSKNDVFENENVQLETLDSAHTAPMDRYDVTFDATNYLSAAQNFVNAWNEGYVDREKVSDPKQHLEDLANELIYSADWFPYSADKRIKGHKAKKIAKSIQNGTIVTKRQLAAAIGSTPVINKGKTVKVWPKAEVVCSTDKNKLWELWRRECIKRDGEAHLTSWQFKRAYRMKLQKQVAREEITEEEANWLLKNRMQRLFPEDNSPKQVGNELLKPQTEVPEWLSNLPEPLEEEVEEDYEFQAVDWLENHESFLDEMEQGLDQFELEYNYNEE